MKKGLLFIGIVAWAAVLAVAILVGGSFLRGGFALPDNSILLKEEDIPLSGISEILIEADSLDIEFIVGAEPYLKVLQYGNERTAAEELFSATQKNGSLNISVRSLIRIFNISFGSSERLVLAIPASWLGDIGAQSASGNISVSDTFTWQDISLSSSSGDLLIGGELNAENITLHAISGNILSRQALTVAGKLDITGSSGDIGLGAPLQAQSIYAKVVSGNITLKRAEVEHFDLRTSSGDIRTAQLSGGGYAAATSGNISLDLEAPIGDVELDTSSGDIRIGVAEGISFIFYGNCSSGDIHANFPLMKNERGNRAEGSVGLEPTASIRATAVSGNIGIEQR
jgi:lia operon protein LiaG